MTSIAYPLAADRAPFWGHCVACGHLWPVAYTPMEATACARLMKAARCSLCGGRKVDIPRQEHGALPIAAAPRDGREILAIYGIGREQAFIFAHWSDSAALEHPEWGGWLDHYGRWLSPTHWWPLLAVPDALREARVEAKVRP